MSIVVSELFLTSSEPIRPAAYDVPVEATTRAMIETAMEGEGRRREGRRMGSNPSSAEAAGDRRLEGVRSDPGHGWVDFRSICAAPVGGRWQAGGMGIMKKAGAFAVAKKVYDEARKPHNQAKIKDAVPQGAGASPASALTASGREPAPRAVPPREAGQPEEHRPQREPLERTAGPLVAGDDEADGRGGGDRPVASSALASRGRSSRSRCPSSEQRQRLRRRTAASRRSRAAWRPGRAAPARWRTSSRPRPRAGRSPTGRAASRAAARRRRAARRSP